MKTYTKIERGAPVRLADALGGGLGVVLRTNTMCDGWVVGTADGERRIPLVTDPPMLTLLQPVAETPVREERISRGAAVAFPGGYGVIAKATPPALPGLDYRWAVKTTDGEYRKYTSKNLMALVPAKGHIDEDKERAAREANVRAGLSPDGTQPLPEGGEKILSTAEALKMRQAKEARNTPKEEFTALSNSELAAALEDVVGFSARYSISETLRPLLEQHAARLMVEQWRRANPAIVRTWFADDPLEESDD